MPRDPSKTEPPTPFRLEEAKRRGYIPRSREVTSLLVIIGVLVLLWFTGKAVLSGFSEGISTFFTGVQPGGILSVVVSLIMKILAPVFLVAVLFAVIGSLIQTGATFTTKTLEPNLEKLNPVKGLQRFVSLQGVVELLKSVAKIAIAGYIAFAILKAEAFGISEIAGYDVGGILSKASRTIFKVVIYSSIALGLIAILDYFYQRWEWYQSLWMTKTEVREELKRYEGDPAVKGRLRRRMREITRLRMIAEVPRADVVITNPTHVAVALRYERGKMKAPKVVAKGMGYLATRIIEIAKEHGVTIYRDPPLAWALYKSAEIGDFIPPALYRAVAQVLAYVMKLKGIQV